MIIISSFYHHFIIFSSFCDHFRTPHNGFFHKMLFFFNKSRIKVMKCFFFQEITSLHACFQTTRQMLIFMNEDGPGRFQFFEIYEGHTYKRSHGKLENLDQKCAISFLFLIKNCIIFEYLLNFLAVFVNNQRKRGVFMKK